MLWIINIVGLLTSWHFMDLNSDSSFKSEVCPTLLVIFAICLLTDVVCTLSSGGSGGGRGGGFFGGGDGGCGGDGGGC
ncbi:hypothetical protein ACJJIQ_13115 [Microbulbifer sp. ANSA003]|uniref:hypothetical protein n=1 Tax=unclassified Microbulbifer TaxID=2619833 RepID=UPI0040397808